MKDSPESKYGDVTGFKPIALSLIGGIVSFCIISFFIQLSGDFKKTLFAIPNPFQQDPRKIEVSLLDPKNQDNEALYYRSLMGIIETQIDLRDSAYQFSVPIDEGMTRDICSSKYSVLEGLKGNGLPLGPEMNEKLNRLTTNMQC